MTNETAIRVLKNCATYLNDAFKYMTEEHVAEFKEAYEMAIHSLDKWIPCSERLPEKDGTYIVAQMGVTKAISGTTILCYASNLYEVDKYDFADKKGVSGWYDYDSEYGYFLWDGIVAWMPLPSPYKGESKNEEEN